MASNLYDASARTSVVTSAGAMIQLVPPVGAVATARNVRLREVAISNTTATGFAVGLGIATAAAVTPATPVSIARRNTGLDPAPISLVWTTFTTTPTAPTAYHKRLWIPASALVIYSFLEGEELLILPNATPLPFCVWNIGTGQISDVSLTWSE